MRSSLLVLAAAALLMQLPVAGIHAQSALTLHQAVDLAQKQSFGARTAAASRESARQRERAFNASLLPQVSITGDIPTYDRSILPITQPDGSTIFRAQQNNRSALNLQVAQRLPFTGGSLFVTSSLSRLQIEGAQTNRSWSSTPFLIGITQDIFKPNALRWDSRDAGLTGDVAERQFLENREDVAITTTNAYFDHYAARLELANAEANAAVNDTLYTINKGRFEVGKIGENDLLQSELALLRSRNALATARLTFARTLAALRLQLNIDPGTPLEVEPTDPIPNIVVDTMVAVQQALRNRSVLPNQELQRTRAKRAVNEARLNNGFGATLRASYGYNQTATDLDLAYRDLLNAQRLSLSVSMPMLQWGGRGAQIEAAKAEEDRVTSQGRLAQGQLQQDALFAALQLSQSRDALAVSAKADTVATKRFEVAKNRYVIGKIGMDNLYLAQNEKDQALRAFVDALRGYWNAFYRLRRTTLYDFEAGTPIR